MQLNINRIFLLFIYLIFFVKLIFAAEIKDSNFYINLPDNFIKDKDSKNFRYTYFLKENKDISIGFDTLPLKMDFQKYVYTYLSEINKTSGVYILSRKDLKISGYTAKEFTIQTLDAKTKGLLLFVNLKDKLLFVASSCKAKDFSKLSSSFEYIEKNIKINNADKNLKKENKEFYSNEYFSFLKPKGWNLIKQEGNKYIFYNELKVDDDVNLSILIKKKSYNDFDNYFKSYLSLLKTKLGMKILTFNKLNIDNKQAYKSYFLNSNSSYKGILYIINAKKYSYVLIFMSKFPFFDNHIAEFNKIISSFKVKE